MSNFFKKIFGNQTIDDLPFPEIPAHTHDGQNSPVLAPSSIDSVQIKTGAVGESQLLDLSVTEEKLAALAVATSKIKNGAVTATKLIQSEAVVTLSAQIAEAVIATAHIQDLAVKWAKIGNLEVGNSKIMNEAVGTSKIQDLNVTTAKINDLAVEWAKIGSLAVGNSKIMNEAVSNAKIQNLAVTNAKINDLSADKINAGILQGITVRTGATSGGHVAMETGGSYSHSFSVYAGGGAFVGWIGYVGNNINISAMADITINTGVLYPYADNVVSLGSSSLKYYAIYRTNEFSCPLPTSNSGIAVMKKIKRPQVSDGDFGTRHYFKVEDFPAEMKARTKPDQATLDAEIEKMRPEERALRRQSKINEDKEDIELTRTLGVTVEAVRELIEKFDGLDSRIAAVETKVEKINQ